MRGERALLRIGEYLVSRACRRLPRGIRDERYREWAAELPAILHDRENRLAPYRAGRMLAYAADTRRGAARAPGRARRRASRSPALVPGLIFMAGLVVTVWSIWDAARAPGDWVNYVQLAWSLLLVAGPIGQFLGSTARMTGLIFIAGTLAGVVVFIGNAMRAPGDWVNYLMAAWLFLLLVAWRVTRRWGRAGRRNAGRAGPMTAP